MRQHYGLDRLAEYGIEPVPDPTQTVNPAWRKLHAQIRVQAKNGGGNWRCLVRWSFQDWPRKRSLLTGGKRGNCRRPLRIWIARSSNSKHSARRPRITFPSRNCRNRLAFSRLLTERKHFIDTIKPIAYRAETSMALPRDKLSRADDARSLLRQIQDTEVELIPDLENKTFTVRLHHLT